MRRTALRGRICTALTAPPLALSPGCSALLAEYDRAGGTPLTAWMLTLAYANPLYDDSKGPHSAVGVAAFVRFTVAAVTR